MTTVNLADFLVARIAEDEARLRKLLAATVQTRTMLREHQMELLGRLVPGHFVWPDVEQAATAALTDVDAKRRIVERCRPRYAVMYRESERLLAEAFDQSAMQIVGSSGPMWPFAEAEALLRLLALPHADHPDYREEWRP